MPGVKFSSIIIDKENKDYKSEFKCNPYFAYQEFTEILLLNNISDSEVLTVLADYISTPVEIYFEVDTKEVLIVN